MAKGRGLSAGAEPIFAALEGLLVMAPWMIAKHATSGTFLSPPWGTGSEYHAYGLITHPPEPARTIIIHKVIPFLHPPLFFPS